MSCVCYKHRTLYKYLRNPQRGDKMKTRLRYFSSTEEVEIASQQLGCDIAGVKIMAAKALFHTIEVQDINTKAAIICKQEMMALGGEVILSREVMTLLPKTTTLVICGTQKQHKKLARKLYQQPFGCKELAQQLEQIIIRINQTNNRKQRWQIKDALLDFTKPIIMGIVNITPDSFSDGSLYLNKEHALRHGKQLITDGADILDLGAESSRPGSNPVSAEEEVKRLVPVLQALIADPTINVPISIDTYKPEVAKVCLEAGAHIINDISGLQNPAMQEVVAHYKCPVIMMHMRGIPKTMQENPQYKDVVDDIISFFQQQIKICEEKGITQVILDPGIGFGKTVEHNLQIIKRLKEFHILGKPLLIGTSRKSFIEKTVGSNDATDRLEGTITSNVIAAMHGCSIFRVHDVKACKRALDLTKKIEEA
jgi:dihydropteroate synthase